MPGHGHFSTEESKAKGLPRVLTVTLAEITSFALLRLKITNININLLSTQTAGY